MDIFKKCEDALTKLPRYSETDRAVIDRVIFRTGPIENAGPWIEVEGRRILQFSTNDYLGLSVHPRVREAAATAASAFGVGLPMGSRALTGQNASLIELERIIAQFKRTEDAMVFTTGADAMMGTIAALATPHDWVVFDANAHASLVCGARIAQATIRFFRHSNLESLERVLQRIPPNNGAMVVVDGVYSMQGDMAPLLGICDVCERYGARFVVDDAHGTGVFGQNGRGTAAYFDVEHRIDLHLGTFSKAVGTHGGFAAGSHAVIEYIKHHAPTTLFSKAIPACTVAATLESIKILIEAEDRRRLLWQHSRFLQDRLYSLGYDIGATASPITPIYTPESGGVRLADALYREFGIWVAVALYPAVSLGTSLIRVVPTACHTHETIEYFLSAMQTLRGRFF